MNSLKSWPSLGYLIYGWDWLTDWLTDLTAAEYLFSLPALTCDRQLLPFPDADTKYCLLLRRSPLARSTNSWRSQASTSSEHKKVNIIYIFILWSRYEVPRAAASWCLLALHEIPALLGLLLLAKELEYLSLLRCRNTKPAPVRSTENLIFEASCSSSCCAASKE